MLAYQEELFGSLWCNAIIPGGYAHTCAVLLQVLLFNCMPKRDPLLLMHPLINVCKRNGMSSIAFSSGVVGVLCR